MILEKDDEYNFVYEQEASDELVYCSKAHLIVPKEPTRDIVLYLSFVTEDDMLWSVRFKIIDDTYYFDWLCRVGCGHDVNGVTVLPSDWLHFYSYSYPGIFEPIMRDVDYVWRFVRLN